jgi:hypothetical protein
LVGERQLQLHEYSLNGGMPALVFL